MHGKANHIKMTEKTIKSSYQLKSATSLAKVPFHSRLVTFAERWIINMINWLLKKSFPAYAAFCEREEAIQKKNDIKGGFDEIERQFNMLTSDRHSCRRTYNSLQAVTESVFYIVLNPYSEVYKCRDWKEIPEEFRNKWTVAISSRYDCRELIIIKSFETAQELCRYIRDAQMDIYVELSKYLCWKISKTMKF